MPDGFEPYYLTTMEAALGQLDKARRREIVAEISDHLEDKARRLMLRGLSEEAIMGKGHYSGCHCESSMAHHAIRRWQKLAGRLPKSRRLRKSGRPPSF